VRKLTGDDEEATRGGKASKGRMGVGRWPRKGPEPERTLWLGACCNTHAAHWRSKPSRWCETTRAERGAAAAARSRRRPRRGLPEWTPGRDLPTEGRSLKDWYGGVVRSTRNGRPDAEAGDRTRRSDAAAPKVARQGHERRGRRFAKIVTRRHEGPPMAGDPGASRFAEALRAAGGARLGNLVQVNRFHVAEGHRRFADGLPKGALRRVPR